MWVLINGTDYICSAGRDSTGTYFIEMSDKIEEAKKFKTEKEAYDFKSRWGFSAWAEEI